MRYYLGLDGGGTKTAACILDENCVEVGRGHGGPCNIATGTLDGLRDSITAATGQALESAGLAVDTRFEGVCAGVAGYTAKRRRAEFRELLAGSIPAARHRLEPDFVIAYWGATGGEPGIIVSAGTGAVVYGRNEKGETCREDGRGFLLGDTGSGFFIGKQALQYALAHASCGARTAFTTAILSAIGAEDSDDLIEWTYRDFSPARISNLASTILRLADEGNKEAVEQAQFAAHLLRASSYRVASDLHMECAGSVYVLGSLWKSGRVFSEAFCERSGSHAQPWPEITLRDALHDAAYGAAFLATITQQADGDA